MHAWQRIDSGTTAALSGVWADARSGRIWTIAREPAAIRMRAPDGAWVEWGFDAWREPAAIAGADGAVCVATAGGILVAADGVTWKRADRAGTCVVADSRGALFALDGDLVMVSRDGGATFRDEAKVAGAIALAATESGVVVLAEDRVVIGDRARPLPKGDYTAIAAGTGCLYVAGCLGGGARVLASTDDGASWTARDLDIVGEPVAIAADGADVAIVVGRAGLARSTSDGGESWSREKLVTGADLLAITTARGRAYVVGEAGAIFAREL